MRPLIFFPTIPSDDWLIYAQCLRPFVAEAGRDAEAVAAIGDGGVVAVETGGEFCVGDFAEEGVEFRGPVDALFDDGGRDAEFLALALDGGKGASDLSGDFVIGHCAETRDLGGRPAALGVVVVRNAKSLTAGCDAFAIAIEASRDLIVRERKEETVFGPGPLSAR